MAKRELQEINAGSMADIAFLLLIFFLVTTTMDQDSGIMRQLPPIAEEDPNPKKAKMKNVFEVLVNANDQLLVEGSPLPIEKLKDETIMFLTNKGVFKDLPGRDDQTERTRINKAAVLQTIANNQAYLKDDPDNSEFKRNLKKAKAQLDAINYFGSYKALDAAALISLKNDLSTSYDMYIQIQNELTSALNQLRDELVEEKFNKSYLELDERDIKEQRIILAVRQIYPQRISEAEPNQ